MGKPSADIGSQCLNSQHPPSGSRPQNRASLGDVHRLSSHLYLGMVSLCARGSIHGRAISRTPRQGTYARGIDGRGRRALCDCLAVSVSTNACQGKNIDREHRVPVGYCRRSGRLLGLAQGASIYPAM